MENDILIARQYRLKIPVTGRCDIGQCDLTCIFEALIRIMLAQVEDGQCYIIALFFYLHAGKNAVHDFACIRPILLALI